MPRKPYTLNVKFQSVQTMADLGHEAADVGHCPYVTEGCLWASKPVCEQRRGQLMVTIEVIYAD